ncbi:unnamed protein product [Laminaria digitata]
MDRDNKVSWSATMAIWPCRPRDFVTHIRRATLEDGSVAIVNSATTHAKAPVSGRYVRGEISRGVFHIKPAKDKKQQSELTMVHHFNPGGNVPAWLMNWLAEGKPLTFVRQLEEVAAKWDEQAKRSKTMPCKGRGFADKPCEFLLSPKDDADNAADKGTWGWAWANRSGGEWLALAAVLVATVLALYGRAICRDSPLSTLVGLLGLVGAEKEEEPSPTVNGEKLKGENGTHAVVDAAQKTALGTSVETGSEGSVENTSKASVERVSGGPVDTFHKVSVEGVSTGEGEAFNGGITTGGIAGGVVFEDLSSVEGNGVKLSFQEEGTVDNAFAGRVSADKAALMDGIDGEDTPTGEVMTSDVSSEEVQDGEVDGGPIGFLTAEGKETGGRLSFFGHLPDEKLANHAMPNGNGENIAVGMPDGEIGNGENIAVVMPDGEIGNGENITVGGIGLEEGSREQESNGEDITGDEMSTSGSVVGVAVGCVSE